MLLLPPLLLLPLLLLLLLLLAKSIIRGPNVSCRYLRGGGLVAKVWVRIQPQQRHLPISVNVAHTVIQDDVECLFSRGLDTNLIP